MSHESASGTDIARLLAAVHFAADQHRDHRRKGSIAAPYINHPIQVAQQLAAAGCQGDVDLLMAAVLHDVIEDTETTPAQLEERFGKSVTSIVLEVTDDKDLPEQERKLVTVSTVAAKSRQAQLLKLSDLTANTRDVVEHPPNWSRERKVRYFDWAENVVNQLRGMHPELEDQFDEVLQRGRRSVEK